MSELVYFRGGPWDGRTATLPDERDTWAVPCTPERHGAFYFGTSLGPLPQPALYHRAYPRRCEAVLAVDVNVKKGTPLRAFETPFAWATVFDCVSEGGR